MTKVENKPLTKLLGPFFQENCLKQPENKYFMLVFFPFGGYLGTPKWTKKGSQRPASGRDVWPNVKLKRKAPN
jgi:hypothetical protein